MATCTAATEVYSRIVGYHRPIKTTWNKGKLAEWADRVPYALPPNAQTTAALAAGPLRGIPRAATPAAQ